MAKLRQKAQQYADEAFRREIRSRQGYYDLMSQEALSEVVGMPRPTLRKRMLQPGTMTVAELRKLVVAVKPGPGVILALLGYTGNDLKAIPTDTENECQKELIEK